MPIIYLLLTLIIGIGYADATWAQEMCRPDASGAVRCEAPSAYDPDKAARKLDAARDLDQLADSQHETGTEAFNDDTMAELLESLEAWGYAAEGAATVGLAAGDPLTKAGSALTLAGRAGWKVGKALKGGEEDPTVRTGLKATQKGMSLEKKLYGQGGKLPKIGMASKGLDTFEHVLKTDDHLQKGEYGQAAAEGVIVGGKGAEFIADAYRYINKLETADELLDAAYAGPEIANKTKALQTAGKVGVVAGVVVSTIEAGQHMVTVHDLSQDKRSRLAQNREIEKRIRATAERFRIEGRAEAATDLSQAFNQGTQTDLGFYDRKVPPRMSNPACPCR